MITTEVEFAAKLDAVFRKMAKDRYLGYHWQRIEATTAMGIPDVNIALGGQEAWVELKIRRGKSPILYQPYQKAWWHKAALADRNGAVLVWNQKHEYIEIWKFASRLTDFVMHARLQRDKMLPATHDSFLRVGVFSSCNYQD